MWCYVVPDRDESVQRVRIAKVVHDLAPSHGWAFSISGVCRETCNDVTPVRGVKQVPAGVFNRYNKQADRRRRSHRLDAVAESVGT